MVKNYLAFLNFAKITIKAKPTNTLTKLTITIQSKAVDGTLVFVS